MKIRDGFVSNSSSSSFIVAFDKRPRSVGDVRKALFGDDEFYPNPYRNPKIFGKDAQPGWSAEQVSKTVWGEIKGRSLSLKRIVEELRSGSIYGAPPPNWPLVNKLSKLGTDALNKYWEKLDNKTDTWAEKKAIEFVRDNKGKVFLLFTYSDNDGEYFAALEHGGLFEKLPHICISHH